MKMLPESAWMTPASVLIEGGFARAVIADEADDLARVHLEIDIAERLHRTVRLADAGRAQARLAPRARTVDRLRLRVADRRCFSLPY